MYALKEKPKRSIFLSALSEITKGFKFVNSLKVEVIFSKGIITFEKKRVIADIKTDAKIVVSSDLNMYPINIPINIKTLMIKNKIVVNSNNGTFNVVLSMNFIPIKTKINCNTIIISDEK